MIDLSLCMIVKDEERFLEGCLRSVQGVANEIIIVDTGSTDRTIEIAQDFGAVVLKEKWHDDFSRARNLSLKLALGKWILHLDADERLNYQSRGEIFQIIEQEAEAGVVCHVKNLYGNNRSDMFDSIRLFKNGDGLYYSFNVHEQIFPCLHKKGYQLIGSEILIEHIGYNANDTLIRIKALRNLALLLEQRKKFRSGLQSMQIAYSYLIIGEQEKALPYLVEVDQYPETNVPGFCKLDAQNLIEIFGSKK